MIVVPGTKFPPVLVFEMNYSDNYCKIRRTIKPDQSGFYNKPRHADQSDTFNLQRYYDERRARVWQTVPYEDVSYRREKDIDSHLLRETNSGLGRERDPYLLREANPAQVKERDPHLSRETSSVLVKERDFTRYHRGYVENDNSLHRDQEYYVEPISAHDNASQPYHQESSYGEYGDQYANGYTTGNVSSVTSDSLMEWHNRQIGHRTVGYFQTLQGNKHFSGPYHRFPEPRLPGPRIPYQHSQRALLPTPTVRGGAAPWQPFQRNHPPRRRHHLDDIFLPNYDDEEHPIQEEGFRPRHTSNRPPIRIECRTAKPATILQDNTASESKTNKKVSEPNIFEKTVTSTDSIVNIKYNIESSELSGTNESCMKNDATVSKLHTVSENNSEIKTNNVVGTNTKEPTNNEPEKKNETKTSSGTGSKEPVNKNEIKVNDNEKKKGDAKKVPQSTKNEPNGGGTRMTSDAIRQECDSTHIMDKQSIDNHTSDKNKKEMVFPLKDKSSQLVSNQRTSLESNSKINQFTDKNPQNLNGVTSESQNTSNKNVRIPLFLNDIEHKDKEKLLDKKDTVDEKNSQKISNCTSNKNEEDCQTFQIGKGNKFTDAQKKLQKNILGKKIVNSHNNSKEGRETILNRKENQLENDRIKLQENMSEKNSVNNTKSRKTSNASSQLENNSTKEKTDSVVEMDIVKELESLVSQCDTSLTDNKLIQTHPEGDNNTFPINSAETSRKMNEGNLTHDTTPTSVPSSPQAIKKDIRIKLIRSPLPKSTLADSSSPLLKSPLAATQRSPLPKSLLATVEHDLIDRAVPRSPLASNTVNTIPEKDKDFALIGERGSKQSSEVIKGSDDLNSNKITSKCRKVSANTDNIVDYCSKSPPILEEIFILEDAIKCVDDSPEIIEILSSPPNKGSSINNTDKDTLNNNKYVELCSTPNRTADNLFNRKPTDSDDVQIIEDESVIIEIIDDDESSSTVINDNNVKSIVPTEVIKINSPDDSKRNNKSFTTAAEKNRPVEDFCNFDTRGSFLWTFHQRFDDPRVVDMDISHSPLSSDISEEPVRSAQQKETDRVIKDMDALWNEINESNTNNKNPKNGELIGNSESNNVDNEERVLAIDPSNSINLKDSQSTRNVPNCQQSKKSNSIVLHSRKKNDHNISTTPTKEVLDCSNKGTLSEKLMPFSKTVKTLTGQTREISRSLTNVAKDFTAVSSASRVINLRRRASFSCNSNMKNFKTSLRKVKSLDYLVSGNKLYSFKSSQNRTSKSKVMTVPENTTSKSNKGKTKPTEQLKVLTAIGDCRDELLSSLSSLGYQDQICDKIEGSNKNLTSEIESAMNRKGDIMPKPVSNELNAAQRDNATDDSESFVYRKRNDKQKKRKMVRRIDSSDEESPEETPRVLEKDYQDKPKKKKQKLKEKPTSKRKIVFDDNRKNKAPRTDLEKPSSLQASNESQEKSLIKDKLILVPSKIRNNLDQEIISSSAQTPTKYVTKAEYVKTFAKNKSLVPNISLSVEPIPKIQKIIQRRATFTCEADNEQILRKVDSGERCKQKFLDLFGSISEDEEDLIQKPSTSVGKKSFDRDKNILKNQPKNDKVDKKKKPDTKPGIAENDCLQTRNNPSKSIKQDKKHKMSNAKYGDNCKRIKIPKKSLAQNEKKVTDQKQSFQLKDAYVCLNKYSQTTGNDKLKRQKSAEKSKETKVDKDTNTKIFSLAGRRESTSSTDSKSKEGKKYKEKNNLKTDKEAKESDSSNKSDIEKDMSKHRRKSISRERKTSDEINKNASNAGAVTQRQKEVTNISYKNREGSENLNGQLPIVDRNNKIVKHYPHKDNQNPQLSDTNKTYNDKQISKKTLNKRKIVEEPKLKAKGIKDPLMKLKEYCRRNSAPEISSSSSETSLIIEEIKHLPPLYRASEGEVNETYHVCQSYTPPTIKYAQITKTTIVDMICIDTVYIGEFPETRTDSTTVKETQKDDDDVIEIRPIIPMIDLTDEDVRINCEKDPNEDLNNLILEAKKEIAELAEDPGTITLYRSDENDDNQNEEVQAVAASISLGTTERNSSQIKQDKTLPEQEATVPLSSESGLQVPANNLSAVEGQANLNNSGKQTVPETGKEALKTSSPAVSELFSNLVQNLEINPFEDNTILENPHSNSKTGEIEVSPRPDIDRSLSLEDENRGEIQSSINQNSVLTAATLSQNICIEKLNIQYNNQLVPSRINLQEINLTNQNRNQTILIKESSIHPTVFHKNPGQVYNLENQNSLNASVISLNETSPSDIDKNKRPRIIMRPTRAEMDAQTSKNRLLREDLFGQHKGLPQTLREYRPVKKVVHTVVPPALVNINTTQPSPQKGQMVQIQQANSYNAGAKPTQSASLENSPLSIPHSTVEGNQQSVIDLTEDNGELSTMNKKLIVDVFTRHVFFLAHLCNAQNGYIQYLKQRSFCKNYFKAEIALFEDQKQARLLSQSLRLVTELQSVNIRATRNLNNSANEIISNVTYNLGKKEMPKNVTKSMIYLLISQLIKPQVELFTRIPLLKALIRICDVVVDKMFSKFSGTMTEKQRNTFIQQVQEYHKLFGGSLLQPPATSISQPNTPMAHSYTTTDFNRQIRNQTVLPNSSIVENSNSGHAILGVTPATQTINSSGQEATSPLSANLEQPFSPPPIIRLSQQFGPPRHSLLNSSGGSVLVTRNLSSGPPNIQVVNSPIIHQAPVGNITMNPPSFNVPMMRPRFRQPSTFVVPNSSHQTKSLDRHVRDLPGGANTNTLGCTPRYLTSYDMPNQSHVYASLGIPRQRSRPQNLDHISMSTPTPLNISLVPPGVNTQVSTANENNSNKPESPMLLKLLGDDTPTKGKTTHQAPQQFHIPQFPQHTSSESRLMENYSSPRNNNIVSQTPRHSVPQSPRLNVIFQSPRHIVISQSPIRPPPSYEESVVSKSMYPSSSSSPIQVPTEESKKRSENLLHELLSTPDNEPIFDESASPANENFRIKLPFTQPVTTPTVHTTSTNSLPGLNVRVSNTNNSVLSSPLTTVSVKNSQPSNQNRQLLRPSQLNVSNHRNPTHPSSQSAISQAPTVSAQNIGSTSAYLMDQPKQTVVLNQGLTALSFIGPASAMLNLPSQQNRNSVPLTEALVPVHHQEVTVSNQPVVPGINAKDKSSILILNDTKSMSQPEDTGFAYNPTPTLPHVQSSSANQVEKTTDISNSSKNHKFRVVYKLSNNPNIKEPKSKDRSQAQPKIKRKSKKFGPSAKRKKGSPSKIIETVDLLSSDDEFSSENQSDGVDESELDQIKGTEAQLQVAVSEVTNECVESPIIDNQTLDLQVTIDDLPASTSVTQNRVLQSPALDHQCSNLQPLDTAIQISQPTCNGATRMERINNEEDEIETIDLTWIDDMDDQELQREINFVFIKKEEPRDDDEQAQERNNMVVPSPADSGISSPSIQGDEDTTVYTVNVEKLCICSSVAQYNCACGEAWYCGRNCQIKDWESHQKVCSTAHDTVDTDEELLLNDQEVDMHDET